LIDLLRLQHEQFLWKEEGKQFILFQPLFLLTLLKARE
jgi:hypothetical protein